MRRTLGSTSYAAALLLVVGAGCVIPIDTISPDAGGPAGDDGGAPLDGTINDADIPTGTWRNVTANLANLSSECGNLSFVSSKPDEDLLIAGVAQLGLWGSTNGGVSWQQMGLGSDASPPITNRTSNIVYDPSNTNRFWESGLYNENASFVTSDKGVTFTPLGFERNSDGISVDFTDPNRQTMLLGGHEQSQVLYRSTDGGQTWTSVGTTLPPNTNCTHPLVLNAQTHLVGCGGFGGGVSGVFRTTDGATTWTSVATVGGNALPLVASDGSIYWASPKGAGMARSTDQGQTWSEVVGAGIIGDYHPVELPDGRIASIGPPTGTTLYILASADHGATWKPVSSALPYADPSNLAYSAKQKAFYIWHFTCPGQQATPVPADAIMAYDFDTKSP